MDELSTLSYLYDSLSSSDESDCYRSDINEDEKDEVYAQDGKYDSTADALEDRKLQNWNRWIDYRKIQSERMKPKLKRETNDLVMHSDDVHEKRRNANLIDFAHKYAIFDKFRGNPKFWKVPDYIYDKCHEDWAINCPVQDKYDRTVEDKNDPPTLEYIGIPQLIKTEKGFVSPEDIPAKKNSHKCDYLNQRKAELIDNVRLIETHVPDMDNLFVVGEPVAPVSLLPLASIENLTTDFPIIIEAVRGPVEYERVNIDTRFPILKIQGKTVNKIIMNNLKGDLEQVIRFSNCSVNEMYSEKLIVENVGNICVRYTWQQIEPYRNPEIPLYYSTRLVKRFFFPTKSNIFLPGQITEIPFMFKSREPGVYHETWKLVVDPVFARNKSIKFSLQGTVRATLMREEVSMLEAYIRRCHVTTISIGLLDGLMTDTELKTPVPYESHFKNKAIFLHNNPGHFYEFETVDRLFQLHKSITNDDKWDYSIVSLRNNILSCGGSLEDQRRRLEELYTLSKTLLKGNVDLDIDNDKYRSVYQVLCSFFNTLEYEAVQLRSTYRIREFRMSSNVSLKERLSSIETKPLKNGSRSSRMSLTSAKDKMGRSGSTALKKQTNISKTSSLGSRSSSTLKNVEASIEDLSDAVLEKLNQQYIKTLCIKVHQHLLTCVDEITAVIESLNLFTKPK